MSAFIYDKVEAAEEKNVIFFYNRLLYVIISRVGYLF